MAFSDRLKEARLNAKLTQAELGKRASIDVRAISAYEHGERFPRKQDTIPKLASALGVDVSFLISEDEAFIIQAGEKYGSRGTKQAHELVENLCGLFAGGELADEDKDEMMRALQDAYWIAKEKSREKYTPKKYKKSTGE